MATKQKRISILGSTGSIGVNTLKLIDANPEKFKVIGLAAGKNVDLLARQALKFKPKFLSISSEKDADKLKKKLSAKGVSYRPEIFSGQKGAIGIATIESVDLVVSAIVGAAALKPTFEAVKAGKNIALANKESIVMAGEFLLAEAKRKNVNVLPVDSEHSAIFQSLRGHNRSDVKKLILTASGGPFLGKDKNYLKNVNLKQALKHPNWKMGAKITIDSATMMNKALEIIEARWLFDMDPARISVLIHPQSIIHSIVEYRDGSMISQMGLPDMKVPISYALAYPERLKVEETALDFKKIEKLTFSKPNHRLFPALSYAYEALESGVGSCIALNAANEASVKAFIRGKISFLDIPRIIRNLLKKGVSYNIAGIDEAIDLHEECTKYTEKLINKPK